MHVTIPALGLLDGPGHLTQTAGTVIVALIPPYMGCQNLPSGVRGQAFTKVTKVAYTTQGTAHKIGVMRPFNFTTFSADAAAAQAVVNLTADPGLYATPANWKYGTVPGGVPSVANNGIAANDYVVYQAADGTLVLDTVSSVSSLAVALTANLPTGGVKQGGVLWFFGVIANTDPNTGRVNPQTTIAASQTRDATWADPTGVVTALHPGDPMIFYSPNGTNAGTLDFISGYHGKF